MTGSPYSLAYNVTSQHDLKDLKGFIFSQFDQCVLVILQLRHIVKLP